jgi:AcrR family transcriptional regulator
MARVIKENEYAARRNQILDAAQRYVYSKGYEQMSVQDICVELGISKGAFYHYFDSKQGLLDGLIDRIWEEVSGALKPIIQNPDLSALVKLQRYFDTAIQWKTAQKDFVIGLLRVWYADENAIVRQKQQTAMQKRIAPIIAEIIEQGIREGSFSTAVPAQTGEVVITLLLGLGDTWAGLLLLELPGAEVMNRVRSLAKAYTEAMERVLGVPPGSVTFVDDKIIKEWSAA